MDTQPFHQLCPVSFDGLYTYIQQLSNLFSGSSFRNEPKDFALSRAECSEEIFLRRASANLEHSLL
jgi:hypothetical protein